MIKLEAYFKALLLIMGIFSAILILSILLIKYRVPPLDGSGNSGSGYIMLYADIFLLVWMIEKFSNIREMIEDSLYKRENRKEYVQRLEDEFNQIIKIKEWEYHQNREKMLIIHQIQMDFEEKKRQDIKELERIINRARGM